jgi:DnaJ-class molecular chaperone
MDNTTGQGQGASEIEPDAYGRTGERDECDCCGGTGVEYGETCLVCGGFGWTRQDHPNISNPEGEP